MPRSTDSSVFKLKWKIAWKARADQFEALALSHAGGFNQRSQEFNPIYERFIKFSTGQPDKAKVPDPTGSSQQNTLR